MANLIKISGLSSDEDFMENVHSLSKSFRVSSDSVKSVVHDYSRDTLTVTFEYKGLTDLTLALVDPSFKNLSDIAVVITQTLAGHLDDAALILKAFSTDSAVVAVGALKEDLRNVDGHGNFRNLASRSMRTSFVVGLIYDPSINLTKILTNNSIYTATGNFINKYLGSSLLEIHGREVIQEAFIKYAEEQKC